jgi:hypothetical protein
MKRKNKQNRKREKVDVETDEKRRIYDSKRENYRMKQRQKKLNVIRIKGGKKHKMKIRNRNESRGKFKEF